jgi:hypothetical protein
MVVVLSWNQWERTILVNVDSKDTGLRGSQGRGHDETMAVMLRLRLGRQMAALCAALDALSVSAPVSFGGRPRVSVRGLHSSVPSAARTKRSVLSSLERTRRLVRVPAAYPSLSFAPAKALADGAAPDVAPLAVTDPLVVAAGRAVRSLGRGNAEAELCRRDLVELYYALNAQAAGHSSDVDGLFAGLPATVRQACSSWGGADLGARRALVAGVIRVMHNPSGMSSQYGARSTHDVASMQRGVGAIPDADDWTRESGVSHHEFEGATRGSGSTVDTSAGALGRHAERGSMTADEIEAADRAEAEATIANDIPGIGPSFLPGTFVDRTQLPEGEGAILQDREIALAVAYCLEWAAQAGGSQTLGEEVVAAIEALVANEFPQAQSVRVDDWAKSLQTAGAHGGAFGWGLSPGDTILEDMSGRVKAAPAPPGDAALPIVLGVRSIVHRASHDPSSRLGAWRQSVESLAEQDVAWAPKTLVHGRMETVPRVSWATLLPGGASFAALDSEYGMGNSDALASRGASDADMARAFRSGPLSPLGPASVDSSGRLTPEAYAATLSFAAGEAQRRRSPFVPARIIAGASSREEVDAAIDSLLQRCGAGGLAMANERLAVTYRGWATQLDVLCKVALACAVDPAVAALPPPHLVRQQRDQFGFSTVSPAALTLVGLLPRSAASADEVIEVATEGRFSSAVEFGRALGLNARSMYEDPRAHGVLLQSDCLVDAAKSMETLASVLEDGDPLACRALVQDIRFSLARARLLAAGEGMEAHVTAEMMQQELDETTFGSIVDVVGELFGESALAGYSTWNDLMTKATVAAAYDE